MALDGYEVLGYRATVGADSDDALGAVRTVLRGFGPVDVGTGPELPRFELLTTVDGWQVQINGEIYQEEGDLVTALGVLEWSLIAAALSERRDLFQVHGAALCLPTRRAGIVLAGDSRCGKTTLALALMLHGYALFADDVALIDPDTLELQPLRRAPHVSEDTRRLLDELNAAPLSWESDVPRGYFSPPQWAEQRVPVEWLLFPEFEPGRDPELRPLSCAEAAREILTRSPSLAGHPRLALATASRLVERMQVYRFLTGDLEATVAAIGKLVSAPASD